MKALNNIPVLRSILCALVALALLVAPMQIAGPAQAAASVSMADNACLEQQSCCGMDKADCSKAQTCVASCGGIPGLALLDKAPHEFVSGNEVITVVSLSLTPHASTPLRRPPRA